MFLRVSAICVRASITSCVCFCRLFGCVKRVDVREYMYVGVNVCNRVCVCMNAYGYLCVYCVCRHLIFSYACVYMCEGVCVYLCVCMCMYARNASVHVCACVRTSGPASNKSVVSSNKQEALSRKPSHTRAGGPHNHMAEAMGS